MTLSPLLRSFLIALPAATLALASVDPARVQQALSLYDQGKFTEAQTAFTALAAEDPNLVEAQRRLGWIALRGRDPQHAISFLERTCALEPGSSEDTRILGDAYGDMAMKAGLFSKLGWAKKCKAAYEKAVALDPKNIAAHWSLMEFCKMAPGFAGGSHALAHQQADEIFKLNPTAGRFARAGVFAVEKKFPETFRDYENVLTASPDDYAALNQFGQLTLMTQQRLDQGLAALKKCLALEPPPREPSIAVIHFLIGKIYEIQGHKTEARSSYEAALALDSAFTPAAEGLRALH